MALLLHIETSTTLCSVALSDAGKLLGVKEINEGYSHAENLHVFINRLLQENKISVSDLKAIAVSKGPGSYTGLRIGVSAAKGLAYALGIPLISVDTLQLMAIMAKNKVTTPAFLCPMLDARRMEVYSSVYDFDLHTQTATEALIVNKVSTQKFAAYPSIYFFGDGMPKCREVLSELPQAKFIDTIFPMAANMITTAYKKYQTQDFEDVAYFEPFYLKDFLILKKK